MSATNEEKTRLPIANDEPSAEPVVCKKLRTKTGFGTLEGLAHDWREGRSTTAVYWCLRTMETWGTDDRPAEPLACRRGRACFASPDPDEIA